MEHQTFGWWVVCPIDPASQRIILKIVGFYILLLGSPISPCHRRMKKVLNFRCVLLKFWSFESLLTGLEAAASNLSKWKSIGRKLPGHEEVLKSSRTFCRSFCSRSAFVKTKLWRIQISLLELLGVKQNYLMCWIRPITWIDSEFN